MSVEYAPDAIAFIALARQRLAYQIKEEKSLERARFLFSIHEDLGKTIDALGRYEKEAARADQGTT